MDLIDKIFSIIAPYSCLSCRVEGRLICESCFASEIVPVPSCCIGCKRLTSNYETCSKCTSRYPLKAVWTVCDYSHLSRSLISDYKYGSRREASGLMVDSMLEVLPVLDCLVTNVPTSPQRIRQRGFDHAARIAKSIASNRRLPYYDLLRRGKDVHQVGSGREKRISQTEGLFIFNNKTEIKGRSILLIDDVVTTGSSLAAAAKELKKHGAKNVYGLVFARKI